MHFEILVEDQSGKVMLEELVPRVLGDQHTFKIRHYRGAGRIPPGLRPQTNAASRILLDRLPVILKGYGHSLKPGLAVVVVVVDSDDRPCARFLVELESLLSHCDPAPPTMFRLAIEEMEAWLLGDRDALLRAYPRAKKKALDRYQQDSVCSTWELLADAIHPGGAKALSVGPYSVAGAAKSDWAKAVSPHMDVENNASPSFRKFRDGLRRAARGG